jgi:hypothetical protein
LKKRRKEEEEEESLFNDQCTHREALQRSFLLFIESWVLLKRVAEDAVKDNVLVRLVVEGLEELNETIPKGMGKEVPANLLGASLKDSRKGWHENGKRRGGKEKWWKKK